MNKNTNSRNPEKTIDELARELEKVHLELQACSNQLIFSGKQNVLGDLLSGIAHELNQPLNVTKIICQGILRDIEKGRFSQEETKNDLSEIVRQMDRLSDIIARMCVFARREKCMTLEVSDINTPVQDSLKFIIQQYKDRRIELTQNLTVGLPPVMLDVVAIQQVCLNLLNNARDAVENSKRRPMKIEIKTCSATDGKSVVLEVIDNGTGIPENLKKKIFQPIFLSTDSHCRHGLGLAVCKRIVEEHKGKIEFESIIGEGTLFRVTLPVKGADV